MRYPNKVFIGTFFSNENFRLASFIVIAASSSEVAQKYLYSKFGYKEILTLIPDMKYRTIYDQTGKNELEIQAKVIYSNHVRVI